MNRNSIFTWIVMILSSLMLLFIIAPLAGMFIHTGGTQFLETVRDKEVHQSVWLTLWVSFAATLVFSVGAIPFAWLIARKKFPCKNVVQGIIDLPIVLPHTAAGIALLGFISRDGFLGRTASFFGLNLVNHPSGIALAMAFVSLPFLINAARDGFAAVPERLEKAALNLGANQTKVFFTISLPLAWRSIITGFVMMFARGMSEFGAIVIIAYHPMVAPVLIYERFISFGLNYARPASVFFILVALMFLITLRLLSLKRKEKLINNDAQIE
jgi:molybdate/tungstate transport system permease protein